MNAEIAAVRELLAQSPMAPSMSLDFPALRAGLEEFAALPIVEGATVAEITLAGVAGERVNHFKQRRIAVAAIGEFQPACAGAVSGTCPRQ